ncbi:thymidylate synthase [Kitasatospora kifunensis]|uniref:Thymidylate synthase n=1 Tax=Kitasatospora kifunensis TaxID=58351 RepID=A0A7W7QWY1_KITKI|nr:thymidylate synthase [Kitasatospora kifunensis]MBB4921340.1 thymidylate synthase [Kitasatospora kifunensis]
MISPPIYTSFGQAYIAILRHVSKNYQYVNAPRGNASHECIGVSFQLADPRQRTLFVAARPINPVYHFAEALWYLAGRRDLDMIAHYAPHLRKDYPNGSTIDGMAYGAQIFGPRVGSDRSSFAQVLDLLRSEKNSKRAFLPVFRDTDLDDPASPDVPCLIGLHLLAREGRLHMVAYMRANDANKGLIADVFSFTLIQEFTATLLGLELGGYTHHVGSMHIGDKDLPLVQRVLAETDVAVTQPQFTTSTMPTDTTWAHLRTVLEHEELLRTNQLQTTAKEVAGLGLPPYWQKVVLLFEAHRQIVRCAADPIDPALLEALDPWARWQMERRWPSRVPQAGSVAR